MGIDLKKSSIERRFRNERRDLPTDSTEKFQQNKTRFEFKNEIIVSQNKQLLASELLLSREDAPIHNSFMNGKFGKRLAKDILEQQLYFLISLNPSVFPFKFLFINVERNAFVNQNIISLMTSVHSHFKNYGKSLVVETTERQYSYGDKEYLDSLEKLKNVDIKIALDDYQVGDDFREEELDAGLYDFVKVDNPFFNIKMGIGFSSENLDTILRRKATSDAKWIVERVEDECSLNHLLPFDFWGYQGYLFNRLQEHYPECSLF